MLNGGGSGANAMSGVLADEAPAPSNSVLEGESITKCSWERGEPRSGESEARSLEVDEGKDVDEEDEDLQKIIPQR